MDSAVIFYDEQAWLAGEAVCFGARFDAMKLPKNSVVVGFMKFSEKGVEMLLTKPHIEPNQERSWRATLINARAVLFNDGDVDTPFKSFSL